MMHGGLTLAFCKSDSLTCTTASVLYNVTMEAARAVLTITNMDAFYYGPLWCCRAGPKVASLQLKYFRKFYYYNRISVIEIRYNCNSENYFT